MAALILFVRAIIDALEAAEKIAKTRAAGAVDARNTARDKVEYDLEQLRQYVQLVADANPKDAHAIIHSALLTERQASTYHKPEFEATTGETPGSALLPTSSGSVCSPGAGRASSARA